MPTLNALPAGAKVAVRPGNAVDFAMDWDADDSLTGRTFTSKLNGETVDVDVSGQTISVSWPAENTAGLPSSSQWVLYETTNGNQALVVFDVVATSRVAAGPPTPIEVSVGDLAVTVTVTGSVGGGGISMSAADARYVALSTVTAADDLIVGSGNGTVSRLAVAASRFVGKKATGGLAALTATEAKSILSISTADVAGLGSAALVSDSALAHLAGAESFSGAKTFADAGLKLVGPGGGTTTFATVSSASDFTITFPAITDRVVTLTLSSQLTNKRLATGSAEVLTNAKVDAAGGGVSVPFHASGAFLGLSYVATEFNGGAGGLDTRSTRAPSLTALSAASSGSGYHSQSGDVLGRWNIGGSHDSALTDCALIQAVAGADFSQDATSAATRWQFWTSTLGTDAKVCMLTIDDDGGVIVGSPDTAGGAAATRTFSASTDSPASWFGTRGTSTWTSSFTSATFPTLARESGVYVFTVAPAASNMKRGFVSGFTIKNDPGLNVNWSTGVNQNVKAFEDINTLTMDTSTGKNIGINISFKSAPTYNVANSGTVGDGSLFGFEFNPTVGASVTLGTVTGFHVSNPTVNGTATLLYGLDIAALTAGATNVGIRNASKSRFVAAVTIGADAAATGSNILDVQGTANFSSHVTLEGVTSTGATGTGKFVFDASPTITGHATIEGVTATGATGTGKFVFDASPTITGHATIEGVTATGATGTGKFVFDASPTLTGAPTLSGTAGNTAITTHTASGTVTCNAKEFQNFLQTTDGTQSTAMTAALAGNTTTYVTAWVTARRTSGGSGSADDGAAYKLDAVFKSSGQIGSTTQVVVGESQAAFDATLDASGGSWRVRVTGATSNNIDWTVFAVVHTVT